LVSKSITKVTQNKNTLQLKTTQEILPTPTVKAFDVFLNETRKSIHELFESFSFE